MNWLTRHSEALQALGALITALVAIGALIAIPLQIKSNAAQQAEQSAREIYREFVALSIQKPQFIAPEYCTLKSDPLQFSAYSYYVEYLLYTAEQVTTLNEEWTPVMIDHLQGHVDFLCQRLNIRTDSPAVAAMMPSLTLHHCDQEPAC